jgi:cytochrome c peroxidase
MTGLPSCRCLLAIATLALSVIGMVPLPGVAQALEPKLPDLTGIVTDRDWAIVLGKALFWDTSVGSDGMACASCHFHAGADIRVTNALSPGLLNWPEPDETFGATQAQLPFATGETASRIPATPNYSLVEEDFPFHRLADPLNRNSNILVTTNDVVSSAGTFGGTLTGTNPVQPGDRCEQPSGDIFHAGGFPARQVEPRNTPTVINAVFNHRNFWDGRASNVFNGVGVFGLADIDNDPRARIVVEEDGQLVLEPLQLEDASLASQAVGPPLSNLEMSCDLRTFADLGRKLLSPARRPLAAQTVHPDDSVLGQPGRFGDLRDRSGKGLSRKYRYAELVKRAFDPKYWKDKGNSIIDPSGQLVRGEGGYTQMELNFAMFWGLAILLYESTLISDQSPFDNGELSEAAERGRLLFNTSAAKGGGQCSGCHRGLLFSSATVQNGETFNPLVINDRPNGLGEITPALRDNGFFNLGVRPVAEDVGVGGSDPYGGPLSIARQSLLNGTSPNGIERTVVDGGFKVPILRNVALTPPYLHNGGFASLRQVLEFYRRTGDRRDASLSDLSFTGDDSGTGLLGEGLIPVPGDDKGTNAAGALQPLNLTDAQLDDLVEFLKSLTDPRVQCDQAPFDHPELFIPIGHQPTDDDRDGRADDIVFILPAIGADGYAPDSDLCIPNEGDLFAPGMQARVGG